MQGLAVACGLKLDVYQKERDRQKPAKPERRVRYKNKWNTPPQYTTRW